MILKAQAQYTIGYTVGIFIPFEHSTLLISRNISRSKSLNNNKMVMGS